MGRRLGDPLLVAATALVVIATTVAFASHAAGDFVWDDKGYLLEHPRLQPGAPLGAMLRAPIVGQAYRPLSTATLWLGAQVHGMSMPAFRLTQLALHLAAGATLGRWLVRRGLDAWFALLGAAIFLLHPATTEAVMEASARHDLLGALFALLALLAFDDGRAHRNWGLAAIAVAAATACKESFVVVGPLLALQAWLSREGAPRRPLVPAAAMAIGLLASGSIFGVRYALGISAASDTGGLRGALAAVAALLLRHLRAFASWTDAPTAERYRAPSIGVAALVVATAIALTIAAFAWARRERRRASPTTPASNVVAMGLALLVLALAPSAAAVPATGQYGNRYGYASVAGFAAVLAGLSALAASRFARRENGASAGAPRERSTTLVALVARVARVVVGALALGLVLSAWRTERRAALWRSGLALFGDDVARIPDDPRAAYHYGVEVIAARGCGDAIGWFFRAAEAEQSWARPLRNVAGCALRLGRPDLALAPAERAVALEPKEPAHRRNLASALAGLGRRDEAMAALSVAEQLAPGAPANAALRVGLFGGAAGSP